MYKEEEEESNSTMGKTNFPDVLQWPPQRA